MKLREFLCLSILALLPEFAMSQTVSAISNDSIPQEIPDSLLYDTTLDDLVVTAKKRLIQSDGATLTYNVSEDPEAQSTTTLEVLRKVPGVTVDANDEIKVNGQSSFKVFLNGKEDPMLSGDIKTILKSMPAASIKKIEVISEPGAKYEAEGTGGILNIVTTTKQNLEGYLANVNLYLNSRGIGGGLYGRTKYRNITASANVYYNQPLFKKATESTSRVEHENLESFTDHLQITDSRSNDSNSYIGGNVNLSWEPDTLNLFTFSFNGSRWAGKSTPVQQMRMYDADGGLTYSLNRWFESKYSGTSFSAQASYQHTFRKEGHHIVFSYSYNRGNDDNNSYIETTDVYNYPGKYDVWSHNMNESHSDSHIFQIDYANPFSKKHLLEVGLKGNLKSTPSNSAPFYGASIGELKMDETQHVKLRQFNDILAIYASYTGNFNKWSVRAGLRYEYTHRGIKYRIVPEGYHDFTNLLNDLVPNASVTYKITDAQNIRAAYQMRISRPGLYALNPYRNTLTPGQVSYGNPYLESEKNHNISIAYSNYAGKLSGSFKTTYYFSNNAVTDIIFSNEDGVNTTYANVGNQNSVRFELNLNWNIINNLNFGLWMSETYEHIEAESELLHAKRVNWRTNINANADYTTPSKIRMSVFGGYGSPWVDLQSKGTSWYYYGVGISRSFLKEDRLTVNIFAQNFLPAKRKSSWTQISESAKISSRSTYNQWNVGVGVSWRFGGLKSDVKKTGAVIEEETTSSGGGNKSN